MGLKRRFNMTSERDSESIALQNEKFRVPVKSQFMSYLENGLNEETA